MNLERLKIWRDALLYAQKRKRKFDLTFWVRKDAASPCGFAACAGGDLAMYRPAQDLGMRLSGSQIYFDHYSSTNAIARFLEARGHDHVQWVFATTSGSNSYGVYTDRRDRDLPAERVTRKMVIARIEAMIKELETA